MQRQLHIRHTGNLARDDWFETHVTDRFVGCVLLNHFGVDVGHSDPLGSLHSPEAHREARPRRFQRQVAPRIVQSQPERRDLCPHEAISQRETHANRQHHDQHAEATTLDVGQVCNLPVSAALRAGYKPAPHHERATTRTCRRRRTTLLQSTIHNPHVATPHPRPSQGWKTY